MTAVQTIGTPAITRPARPPGATTASVQVAVRALRKYIRTPGLSVMGIVQSAMFLFSFRYVFGGAIHAGGTSYVNFLVPAYVATIVLFTGGGIAVVVAEDRAAGFTDRLLSLPVPRYSLVLGRALADSTTNVWSIVSTAAFGFLFGFRLRGSLLDGMAAFGLCLAYAVAFTVVFISSAYVPATSMPGWLQPFSKYQPVTPMVDAVRSLLVGSSSDVGLALAWSGLLVLVFTPIAVLRYRRG